MIVQNYKQGNKAEVQVGLLHTQPENFDKNLYGVYSTIGYNKTSQLEQIEKVVASVGNLVEHKPDLEINYYKDFTDYCIKKGFVKKDGTIDLEAYEKAIKNLIVKEAEMQNFQDEITEYDVVVLEDSKEYVVIDEITENNNTYIYLTNLQDEKDFCVRKVINEGSEKHLIGLSNNEEFDQALLYFANKNN